MFLKDCWYVTARGHEATEAPLACTLLGEPGMPFRTPNGGVLADRC